MKRKGLWYRLTAWGLFIILLTGCMGNLQVEAQEKKTFQGDGFEVEFTIESQWDGAFNGNIKITNTGKKDIENWILSFDMPHEITNIWNAVVQTHKGKQYLIKNAGWNQDIRVGGSVSFGFGAKAEGKVTVPEKYSMPVGEKITGASDFKAEFKVSSDWKDGYTAAITLTNLTDEPIEDWILEFDFDSRINTIWNGIIESQEGSHFVVRNDSHNQNIRAGGTVSFGFDGVRGNTEIVPVNYVLRERTIEDEPADDDTEDEKVELIDIGEAYFKPLDAADVVTADDGIIYAKNQLNIVAVMGTAYSDMEKIGKKHGFKIVGYIELTDDYQVEFDENKDYKELLGLAEELEEYKQIETVYVYSVGESDDEDTYPKEGEWPNSGPGNVWGSTPLGLNWGVEAINAPKAWDERNNMQPVKIGLIDNQFDTQHEDLNFVKVWNNPKTKLESDHGTHVAGTMAAEFDNGKGITGVAVKKALYAYAMREGEPKDTDKYSKNLTGVMEYKYAFALLIGNGVRVINVSRNNGHDQCFAASRGNIEAINYFALNAKVLGEFLERLLKKGYDFTIISSAGNVGDTEYVRDNSVPYGYRKKIRSDPASPSLIGSAVAKYNSFLNNITISSVWARIVVVGSVGLNASSASAQYRYSQFSNIGGRVDVVAPGMDIYSTIKNSSYGNKSGTSMAAPHVAGVAGLMYSINSNLSGIQIRNIITSTLQQGKIPDTYGNSYQMVDADKAVQQAKTTTGNMNSSSLPTPKTIVLGRLLVLKSAPMPVEISVKVEERIKEGLFYKTVSSRDFVTPVGSDGQFEIFLDKGVYNITINSGTYKTIKISNKKISGEDAVNLGSMLLYNGWGDFTVKGTINDAVVAKGVSEATLIVREGWDNTDSREATVMTIKADGEGGFSTQLPEGYYTAEVRKDGYISEYMNIISTESYEAINQDLVLTPQTKENEYRIVLTWNKKPEDLDAHLTGPDGVQRYHVYFENKSYGQNGAVLANLDRDASESYGPETVTFTASEEGTYHFYVYDYTNRDLKSSKELSKSAAKVRIYKGNSLITTYHVPENKKGNLWDVFVLEDGVIRKIRSLGYNSNCEKLD